MIVDNIKLDIPIHLSFIQSSYEYQDVNKDMNLRQNMTIFFHKKVVKWIHNNEEFTKYKHMNDFLHTKKGYKFIYTLLRIFVKKYNLNWFDLKDNYYVVKDYLEKKLATSSK